MNSRPPRCAPAAILQSNISHAQKAWRPHPAELVAAEQPRLANAAKHRLPNFTPQLRRPDAARAAQ